MFGKSTDFKSIEFDFNVIQSHIPRRSVALHLCQQKRAGMLVVCQMPDVVSKRVKFGQQSHEDRDVFLLRRLKVQMKKG